jgi:phospholipid/cholesterol/gamma-HCH transport system substrate-binding protein
MKFGELPATISKFSSFQVFVQFPTAPGVQRDTPVRFCGYQIGRVTDVMAPQKREDLITGLEYHQTVVVLSINKKYVNIPSNVEVKLMTRGLGSSYIELKEDPTKPKEPRDPNRPETIYLVDKMRLQGSTGMTSEFFPEESQEQLTNLIDGIKNLVQNTNDILGDPNNKENFKTTLANLSEATKEMGEAVEKIEKFFASGATTSEELSKTVTELRLILAKINEGEGAAAKFVNDGRLYENLLDSTEQLQVLLKELKSFVAQSREKGLPLKLK